MEDQIQKIGVKEIFRAPLGCDESRLELKRLLARSLLLVLLLRPARRRGLLLSLLLGCLLVAPERLPAVLRVDMPDKIKIVTEDEIHVPDVELFNPPLLYLADFLHPLNVPF